MSGYSIIVDDGAAVTPSNTPFTKPGSLYVGTGGNLDVRTRKQTNLSFNNVQDGTWIPVVVDKVYDTSTATNIVLLYT